MTAQELAVRGSVSPELAQLGIRLETSDDGYQAIVIPDEIHARFNVLLPVSQIAQADPDWTPSIRVARLDPSKDGPHFYNQQGRLAPRKEALGLLADLAGVESIHTERVPRDRLAEGERLGITATVAIRRSDGRLTTVTATKTFDDEVEQRKIRRDLAKSGKPTDGPEFHARWIQEREHGPRKVETKAINAALRQVLHIPHTFDPADAGKPFLVVGYAHTPTDPETRRLLAQHAAAQLYGRDLPHGPATQSVAEPEGAETEDAPVAHGESATGHRDDDADFADSGPQPARDGVGEQTSFEPPEEIRLAREAGRYTMTFGPYQGRTLEEIASAEIGDPGYIRQLAASRPSSARARDAVAAAKTFLPLIGDGS